MFIKTRSIINLVGDPFKMYANVSYELQYMAFFVIDRLYNKRQNKNNKTFIFFKGANDTKHLK